MTKSELIKIIHHKNNFNYVDIEAIINQMFEEISSAITNEDKVVISGFGTFEKYFQQGYYGVNPSTGDKIFIDGNYKIRFNASKKLKANLK